MTEADQVYGFPQAIPEEPKGPYLFGSYYRTLDYRSRLVLPPLFRPWFSQVVVVREWIGYSLTLCRPEDWLEIMARLTETEMKHLSLIEVESLAADHTASSKIDKMGRFLIPPQLLAYAGLKPGDRTLVLGVGKRVEVWNMQKRDEFVEAMKIKSTGSTSSLLDWFLRRGGKEIHLV
ncbi:MAG: hypothetical protein HYW45_01800 [Candidatus Daviesbacteria bacterium]|nr:MAG: hypothetical protein HYW45_01800 [Candidatus Daviesbacteria bacterium]